MQAHKLTLAALITTCILGGAPVRADDTGADDQADEAAVFLIEEITVTAQKREQSVQEVPIAISAYDARTLEAIKAVSMDDIAIRVPNFTMMQFNIAEPRYFIRGLGSSSDSAGSDPTVAVFLDEVYIGRGGASNFDFFDLERIEVLRGPQGTLFGRNTSGGALSVITKKPSLDSRHAKWQVGYGNKNAVEVRAVGNLPVALNAAVKGAISYRRRDGFSRHIETDAELQDAENISGRAQALFEPTADTRLLLSADYAQDDTKGNARVPFPVSSTGNAFAPALSAAVNAVYPPGSSVRRSFSKPESYQDRKIYGLMARLEHEAAYGLWTAISSYRKTRYGWFEDLSTAAGAGGLLNDDITAEKSSQLSAEVRLASLTDSEVQWVAGAYFLSEEVDRSERFVLDFLSPLLAFKALPSRNGPPLDADGDVTFTQASDNDSYAVFGQLTWPLTAQLSVTGGLRFTRDEKEIHQVAVDNAQDDPNPGVPLFPGQPYDLNGEDSWNALTGRAGLEYTTAAGHLLWAAVSRGYKSGVFPSQNNVLQSVNTALAPEKVWNYEVGLKSDWLDGRLRLNATGFYTDYKDLQQFLLTPTLILVTFNVDARILGAELETVMAPFAGVQLGATASFIDTEIKNYMPVPNRPISGLASGNELAQAPRTSFNLFGSYETPLANGLASMRLNYSWRDDFFNSVTNRAVNLIPGYGLLDARLAYRWDNGMEIALWGKNLTDAEYQSHTIGFLGSGFSLFGPPRTFGVTFTATYD